MPFFRSSSTALLRLAEVSEAHAAQNVVGLRVLDVGVGGDLDPVAPWIQEVEEPSVEKLHPHLGQGPAHERLVVDRDAEVPVVVRRLPTAFGEVDELVAEVDEGGVLAAAGDIELEEPSVEVERLVDVTDLQGDVVDADGSGLGCGIGAVVHGGQVASVNVNCRT